MRIATKYLSSKINNLKGYSDKLAIKLRLTRDRAKNNRSMEMRVLVKPIRKASHT